MVICHDWQFCQLSNRTAGYTLPVLVSRLRGEDCSNERPNSSRSLGRFLYFGGEPGVHTHNRVVGEMAMLRQVPSGGWMLTAECCCFRYFAVADALYSVSLKGLCPTACAMLVLPLGSFPSK